MGKNAGFDTTLSFSIPLGGDRYRLEDVDVEVSYTASRYGVELEDVVMMLDNKKEFSVIEFLSKEQISELYDKCYEREDEDHDDRRDD